MENVTKEDILSNNLYLNLATVCADGRPWNTPLFYAFDGKKIYWWSPKKAVHSQNILRNGYAFITVYDSHAPEGEGLGIYMSGLAREVSSERIEYGVETYSKKARKFILSRSDCEGNAPTRLYEFDIDRIWKNSESKDNKMYIDIREEVT